MPPKCKFTKEEIIKAALYLTREEGIDTLTARALYADYIKTGLSQDIAFKGVRTQYILFSIKEPKTKEAKQNDLHIRYCKILW